MPEVMERKRLVILTDEELRQALRLEAAKQDMEMSELADKILRDSLVDALKEVRLRAARKKRSKDSSDE